MSTARLLNAFPAAELYALSIYLSMGFI